MSDGTCDFCGRPTGLDDVCLACVQGFAPTVAVDVPPGAFALAPPQPLHLRAPVGPDTAEGVVVTAPVPIIPEAPVPGFLSRALALGAKVLAVVGPALAVVAPLVVGGPLGLLLTQLGVGLSFVAGAAAPRGPLVGKPVVSGALLAVCVLVAEQGLTLASAMPPGALQSAVFLAVCVAALLAGLPVPTDRIFKRAPAAPPAPTPGA